MSNPTISMRSPIQKLLEEQEKTINRRDEVIFKIRCEVMVIINHAKLRSTIQNKYLMEKLRNVVRILDNVDDGIE